MQIGNYVFRPTVGFTALALLMVPVFILLGWWQIERGVERQELQNTIEQRRGEPPVTINEIIVDVDSLRFRKVSVRGVFEPDYTILLDNAIHQGQAGYYVLTPLHIAGTSLHLLVNRGWVSAGNSRDILPAIDIPTEELALTGFVEIPKPRRFSLGVPEQNKNSWPQRWLYLDIDKFSKAVNYTLQPFVLIEDPDSPHGYVRDWSNKFFELKYMMNFGYAIQWFAFGLIMAIVYIAMSFHKFKPEGLQQNES